jgi:diaminopropionate ammonia-lyase
MAHSVPIEWILNSHAAESCHSEVVSTIFEPGISISTSRLYPQIQGFNVTPVKSLQKLARFLNVGGIHVKDESLRLHLKSFKIMGGAYSIYRFISGELNCDTFTLPRSNEERLVLKSRLGDIVFAAATDGNHGKAIAWFASYLGFESIVYVPQGTTPARISAIENCGATVKVIDGTYDDSVRKIHVDANLHGWKVISDTSLGGEDDPPRWVMQGYSTIVDEIQGELQKAEIEKPTHLFVQGGVGAFAAATIGYYRKLFDTQRPISVVVEPIEADCLYQSAKIGDGAPHHSNGTLDTIMAGLAGADPSPLAWPILWDSADAFLRCPDYVTARGMRLYANPLPGDSTIIGGESGSVTLGALTFILTEPDYLPLKKILNIDHNSHILLINTEGDTDPVNYRKVVWEGGQPVPKEYSRLADFDSSS